jgi:hypothetical protein
MHILWTIIIGFVAGLIARFFHPGNKFEPKGFILTALDDGAFERLATAGRAQRNHGFIDGTRECGTISAASSTGQCAHRSRSFAVLSNFRHDRSRMGGLIGSGHLVRSVHLRNGS